MGAAIATAVSYLVIMVFRMINVLKFITIIFNKKRFIVQILTLISLSIIGSYESSILTILSIIFMCVIVLSDFYVIKNIFNIGLKSCKIIIDKI